MLSERAVCLKIANRIAFCLEELIAGKACARVIDDAQRKLRQHLRRRIKERSKRDEIMRQRWDTFFRTLEQDYVDEFLNNLKPGEEQLVQNIRRQLEENLDEIRSGKEQIEQWRRDMKDDLDFNLERDLEHFNEDLLEELDDGKALELEDSQDLQDILGNSLELVKKFAKSVEHQYILNMNYTTLRF